MEKLSDLFTDVLWASETIEFEYVYHSYLSAVLGKKKTKHYRKLTLSTLKKYLS